VSAIARAFAGVAANPATATVFRADTGALAGLYPFLDAAALPPVGALVGWDTLTLRPFCAHPAAWVSAGLTTNANVLVTGVPGAGKSALLKALVLGDLKGEYNVLAEYLGVRPVRLGRGLPDRINPLQASAPAGALSGEAGEEVHRRRLTLLSALLEIRLARRLTPLEETALSHAIRQATGQLRAASRLVDPTLPAVLAAVAGPDEHAVEVLGCRGRRQAAETTQDLRHGLANMIDGSLGGLFDQASTTGLDPAAPIQTVDISGLAGRSEETVAMVLACLSSWGQGCVAGSGRATVVVRDELWRQVRFAALVRSLDAELRLQRAQGTIQLLATHRLSDFEGAGPAGSEHAATAAHLVSSCATHVLLAQDGPPLAASRAQLGLTDAECALVSSWGPAQRGRGLWKVGRRTGYPVQLVLTAAEQRLFHTDERMDRW
jgi:hypothetical protein